MSRTVILYKGMAGQEAGQGYRSIRNSVVLIFILFRPQGAEDHP